MANGCDCNAEFASKAIEAPLPGMVLQVRVEIGEQVKEGDILCVIESMKMEIPVSSPVRGRVAMVDIAPGQIVRTGQTIFILEH